MNKKIRLEQKARWLPADMDTPISLYLKTAGSRDGILLESAEVDGRWGRYSILAYNMLFYISCVDGLARLNIRDDRFEDLREFNDAPFIDGLRGVMTAVDLASADASLPHITRALYGFLGFGMASLFNPSLRKIMPLSEARCELAFPGSVLVFDHLYNRLCQLTIGEPDDFGAVPPPEEETRIDPEAITASPGEAGYKQYVREIREMLRRGEAIQVVPSTRFCAPFAGDPFYLYRRLRRYNASPYMFYMRFPEITLFGSSPEVMVKCSEGKLLLSPIAGTRKRGADDAEDAALARELLEDPKERAEHVMLVDLGRNDLGRVASKDSVRVEKLMQIERFSHVMHITSSLTANLAKGLDAIDVLAAAFPAGTVSGAPKIRAMEIIRGLERESRGPYAGCVGWIGLDKTSVNLDMGITLRSMWVEDGRVCWQAGGGIVHDSDPDLEWMEIRNKSAIMRMALNEEGKDYVPVNR
ncbi:MAG: anthranilate synthase component I family protein [Desulfovibrio sp.]|nr:anthranilate synthase component I family protein [Desulfovibrio sp.]